MCYFFWCAVVNKTHVHILTHCRRATQKCVIGSPCIVGGSHISAFSYTTSCTCVCKRVWLTNCFKVIDSMMQDACVSSYKQTERSWPPIFRTIRLQQSDHSFRHSLSFLQLPSWLCVGMFCKRTIFCVLYADTCSDLSDYSDNESLDSDSGVPTTSSHKQLQSSTGPLTPQFPHPFFLTYIKTIFITVWD